MSRELKFRAWFEFTDKYMNKYINKELVCGKPLIPALHKVFYYTSDFFDDTWVRMSDYKHEPIVEQYTGLKDANGKEIYEGDIVRHRETVGEIKFDKIKDSDCTYYYIGWIIEYDRYSTASLYEDKNFVEVIGNIHENPELLGDEE